MNLKLIENYSAKGCVVIGETFAIKEDLKALNGTFCKFLKIDGKNMSGWAFSKKRIDALRELIKAKNSNIIDKAAPCTPQEIELNNELQNLIYQLAVLDEQRIESEFSNPEIIIANAMPKIQTISAIEETGVKIGCKKDINIGMVSEHGMTVQAAAENIYENYFYNNEFGYDCQDIRNVLIDVLMTGKKLYIEQRDGTQKINSLKQQIEQVKTLLNH